MHWIKDLPINFPALLASAMKQNTRRKQLEKVEFNCSHMSEAPLTSSLPFTNIQKVIPRVIIGRAPSQFQISWLSENGRDREKERNCERKICFPESSPSCPTASAPRFSGSRSMCAWLLLPLLTKADIIWASTDPDNRQHLMGAVPTGYGKSLPMLVAALLLPPGEPLVDISAFLWCPSLRTTVDAFNTGSTTIIIPPLTVIERQLQEDSMKYGIKVLVAGRRSVQNLGFFQSQCIISNYVPCLLMAPLHRCRQKILRRPCLEADLKSSYVLLNFWLVGRSVLVQFW